MSTTTARPRPIDAHARDLGRFRLLAADEERTASRDELVLGNLRLVVLVAKQMRHGHAPLEDRVGCGHLGLIAAASRFDPARGLRFSTYATHWIRQAIRLGCRLDRDLVRRPASMWDLEAAHDRAAERLGRPPTAGDLGWTPRQLAGFLARRAATPRRVDAALASVVDVAAPCEGSVLDDLAAAEDRGALGCDRLEELLARLPGRQAEVVRLRYGLDGGGGRLYREIAARHGYTRQAAQSSERAALRTLRRLAASGEGGGA